MVKEADHVSAGNARCQGSFQQNCCSFREGSHPAVESREVRHRRQELKQWGLFLGNVCEEQTEQ